MNGTRPPGRPTPSLDGLSPELRGVVAAITLGSVMAVLDTTVINVALQTFSHDLHTPIDGVQWVITGYLLSLGAVIPVSGWAAHRFGARRVFISSIVMFALGSAACGLARSLPELVGFRVLQGIGGGTLLPVGQIILVRSAGPARLARAMSAMGVPLIMAPVFGPTIGGILLEVSWRLIFYINIPIAAAAVICSFKLLKRDAPERVPNPDVIGLFLGAGGMVGLTYGLAQAGAHPFASPDVRVPLLTRRQPASPLLRSGSPCPQPAAGRPPVGCRRLPGGSHRLFLRGGSHLRKHVPPTPLLPGRARDEPRRDRAPAPSPGTRFRRRDLRLRAALGPLRLGRHLCRGGDDRLRGDAPLRRPRRPHALRPSRGPDGRTRVRTRHDHHADHDRGLSRRRALPGQRRGPAAQRLSSGSARRSALPSWPSRSSTG